MGHFSLDKCNYCHFAIIHMKKRKLRTVFCTQVAFRPFFLVIYSYLSCWLISGEIRGRAEDTFLLGKWSDWEIHFEKAKSNRFLDCKFKNRYLTLAFTKLARWSGASSKNGFGKAARENPSDAPKTKCPYLSFKFLERPQCCGLRFQIFLGKDQLYKVYVAILE